MYLGVNTGCNNRFAVNGVSFIIRMTKEPVPPREVLGFLFPLNQCSTFSGTIMPIIRSSRVFYGRLLPVVFGALVFKLSVWCWVDGYLSVLRAAAAARKPAGSNLLYNTLKLLMMGIMVPETCWASNKIYNKNHLLHLVGILLPHINDDARSKSHKI